MTTTVLPRVTYLNVRTTVASWLLTKDHKRIGVIVGDCVDVRGAQHAEAMLDRIGSRHAPLVRELFRNPVTAPGTGAVRDDGNGASRA